MEPSEWLRQHHGALCDSSIQSSIKATLRSQILPAGYILILLWDENTWMWKKQTEIMSDGNVSPSSVLTMRQQGQVGIFRLGPTQCAHAQQIFGPALIKAKRSNGRKSRIVSCPWLRCLGTEPELSCHYSTSIPRLLQDVNCRG